MTSILRPLFVALRAPAFADRPGLRWLLSDRLWPAPIFVLKHRGRRSGRLYATPVEAISEDREGGEVVISPMRGTEGDWYRNLRAGGLVEVSSRGGSFGALWSELSEAESREALGAYRRAHPLYSRIVISTLMRVNRVSGDPLEELPKALPMVRLRLTPKSPG